MMWCMLVCRRARLGSRSVAMAIAAFVRIKHIRQTDIAHIITQCVSHLLIRFCATYTRRRIEDLS